MFVYAACAMSAYSFSLLALILGFLAPYKFLFILYLSISSACFILLGALGQRYATISFGTILLSIYSMFGLGEYAHWYQQPTYFVFVFVVVRPNVYFIFYS